MSLDLSALTPEALDQLSETELESTLEALEVLHKDKRRKEIVEYASYIEVPGTPSPLSDGDRISLLKRKEELRREGRLPDGTWEDLEDIELEPDAPEEEWYPEQLEIYAHQELILNAAQALMEEEPVTGPLSNGHVGIVPDGAMLFMPPGSAKSSYASVVVPTYCMGRWAGTDVICTSYASQLAQRFGRRARHIARSPKFQETWTHRGEPVTVTGDNAAVDQWSLTNQSTFRSVGIMGGVTGNRADLLIIDDPIAGREEAESEVIRDKINAAIKDDLFTRLKPRGKVLLIQTRWHEDDPAGHLLGDQWEGQSGLWQGTDGRWWLVLCCPFLADSEDDPLGRSIGDRLWPQWFDDRFEELARASGERSWLSLYQQKPAASEGVILLKRFWKCWPHGRHEPDDAQMMAPEETEPPKNWTQTVLCYDTALEDGQDNDYTAMTAWAAFGRATPASKRMGRNAEEEQQNLILIGAWRGKVQSYDLGKLIKEHVDYFKPDHIVVERRASGHTLLQELRRTRPRYEDLGQVHYVAVHEWVPPFPPAASGKVPRAHAAAFNLEQGGIWYMPGPASMAVIRECAALPNGRYDDWADTVTMMIIWARTISLLEVPEDVLDQQEEEAMDRERHAELDDDRRLYGRSRGQPASDAARSLYGRRSGSNVKQQAQEYRSSYD